MATLVSSCPRLMSLCMWPLLQWRLWCIVAVGTRVQSTTTMGTNEITGISRGGGNGICNCLLIIGRCGTSQHMIPTLVLQYHHCLFPSKSCYVKPFYLSTFSSPSSSAKQPREHGSILVRLQTLCCLLNHVLLRLHTSQGCSKWLYIVATFI